MRNILFNNEPIVRLPVVLVHETSAAMIWLLQITAISAHEIRSAAGAPSALPE